MPTGKIKRLETEIGTGLICEIDATEDVFFHATALIEGTFDRLREGQKVEFDLQSYTNAPGKSRAINVRVVN